MQQFIKNRLSPFRHKSFRNFFLVQTLSLIGSWSHDLARSWIILEMWGKAGALGTVQLAAAVPPLLFILHGGILVDKVDVRRIMTATRLVMMFAALILAALAEWGTVQYWYFLVYALLEGLTGAFDSPAFQALTVRLVPRTDFQQALAWNSTNFHMARMLGPFIGGFILAHTGPAWVFFFDGVTFLGVVWVLQHVELTQVQRKALELKQWSALKDGFNYALHTPAIRYPMLQLVLTISTIFPVTLVIFRSYLRIKFNLDASEFGTLLTLPALGSMLGALTFAALKPKAPLKTLYLSIPSAIACLTLIPHIDHQVSTAVVMGWAGYFIYLTLASLTVSIHLGVAEEYRGRVGSMIGLCFLSIGPLMSFPVGYFGDFFGFETCIYAMIAAFALLSLLLWFLNQNLTEKMKSV